MNADLMRQLVDRVAARITGSIVAPRCRDCGAAVELRIEHPGGRTRLSVAHPLPLCAEFARAVEDTEPIT